MFLEQRPKLGNIISDSFKYWRKTLLFQIIFSVIFLWILLFSISQLLNYYGIYDDIMNISHREKDIVQRQIEMQNYIVNNPNSQYFSFAIIGVLCFLFPLNLGLFALYRKIDLGEKVTITSGFYNIFIGYRGRNFFIFAFYYLFWILIFNISTSFIVLSFLWIFITLFVSPLIFFKNIRIFQGISITIQAIRKYPFEILVAFLIGIFIKFLGCITFLGIPLFFGFSNIMVYAIYRNIFKDDIR